MLLTAKKESEEKRQFWVFFTCPEFAHVSNLLGTKPKGNLSMEYFTFTRKSSSLLFAAAVVNPCTTGSSELKHLWHWLWKVSDVPQANKMPQSWTCLSWAATKSCPELVITNPKSNILVLTIQFYIKYVKLNCCRVNSCKGYTQGVSKELKAYSLTVWQIKRSCSQKVAAAKSITVSMCFLVNKEEFVGGSKPDSQGQI